MPTPTLPEFTKSDNLKYVKLGYQYLVNNILTFLIIPIIISILVQALQLGPTELLNLYESFHLGFIHIMCSSFLIICIATFYLMSRPRTIYLVDYACFKPPCSLRVPFAKAMEHGRIILSSQPKAVSFQMRIIERSGLGEETCLPPAIHYLPPELSMAAAREEAQMVIFPRTVVDLMNSFRNRLDQF